jgi:3-oxoacyl-[acyl-carrier-protein] synthase-3
MTALAGVATYVPEGRVPLEHIADRLGLEAMQVKVFRRFHGLDRISVAPDEGLLDLLLAATDRLAELRGREQDVRYVLHARTFPVVAPYPHNPLQDLCRTRGLDRAVGFTVTHHACATGLLAIDVAGRLLTGDGDPDALALVLSGEKAFTRDAQLLDDTSVFGEGAAACLVSADGPRDRLLAYATGQRGDFDDELSTDPEEFARENPAALADAMLKAVDRAGLAVADLALILPHNVNLVSWRRLAKRIGFPVDRVLLDNVARYGHLFCADAFVNYRTAVDTGRLAPGDRYLVAAAGAARGATFSAMVFEH